MIPSDLAARLRMLSEASFFDSEPPVQGTARVREIQARLPELLPGQRFTATLQRNLPDGTFQAIVAGRTYTLSLNHAAKAGDSLELVVTQTTPRAVFAQLAGPPAGAAPDPSRPTLSPTGRLISLLLTGQPGQQQPAALAGGKPLVETPPAAGGTVLAPALRQALSQSGLFYESHQSQWLAGKIETAALLREPQGQESPARLAEALGTPLPGRTGAPAQGSAPLPPQAAGTPALSAEAAPVAAAQPAQPEAPVRTVAPVVSGAPEAPPPEEGLETSSAPAGQAQQAPRMPFVPERLMPVVHQQLDALATQNYVWQGQVWPGQTMEWEIEDPEREGRGEGEESTRWNTTLRLTLPRLGGLEARLSLTPAGVALRLLADDPQAVAALEAARERLDEALAAADVPLTGFLAERRDATG